MDSSKSAGSSSDARQACSAVEQQLRADLETTVKGLKLGITIRLVLIVFVAGYMTWVLTSVGKIDAEAVVTTARDNLQGNQPTIVSDIAAQLKGDAPKQVKELRKDLMESLPMLRQEAEKSLNQALEPLAQELENEMSTKVASLVDVYKDKIDKENPNLPDSQKLDRMVTLMHQDVKSAATEVALSGSKEFKSDIHKLTTQLAHLRAGKNLSAKEKLQLETLALWMKLVKIKAKKGEMSTSAE